MNHNRTIIYTGNFSIEHMNAAGKRVFANALIMKEIGYHVVLVGTEEYDKESISIISTKQEIQGIEVFHYPGRLFHKSRLNYMAFYNEFIRFIEMSDYDVKAFINYNSPSLSAFMGKLIKYARKHNIKYITDVADWLIVDSGNYLFRELRQFDIDLKNGYYSNKSDGIIAISSWLSDYYKQKVFNVIIIPPLSLKKHTISVAQTDLPKIVYAGIPFRRGTIMADPKAMKDRFDLVCEYLYECKKRGAGFEFHVFGFDKAEFCYSVPSLTDVLEALGESIVFHSMSPMQTIQQEISSADYTILIRDKNRMTMAGFPTKVSESISCGTPVITTKTSDIEHYLPEGQGAFYLDIEDKEGSCEKLTSLLNKSRTERESQKLNCTKLDVFSMETYYQTMDDFLHNVCG